MTAIHNYVAVNKAEQHGAGAIVWWTINGVTECAALENAWTARVDLDPELLMNRPTPGAALRRALASHVHATLGGKQTVTSLGEENAYAIEAEVYADGFDGEPEHRTLLKVRLSDMLEDDGVTPRLEMITMPGCPTSMPGEVLTDYRANLHTFSGAEISQWFSNVVLPAFHAVSLRKQGGMWFVPATHLDLWYQAVEAVRLVSGHQMWKIPALSTDADAVAGILDALAIEAQDAADALEKRIMDPSISVRGLKNQVAKLDAVTGKVMQYETMLGANLQTLRDRLDALNAQMAAAIFTAEAAKDNAEGEAA